MDKEIALLKIKAIETYHIINSKKICKKWGCYICSIIVCEKSCPEHYTKGGCPECGKDEQYRLNI